MGKVSLGFRYPPYRGGENGLTYFTPSFIVNIDTHEGLSADAGTEFSFENSR
jgi:hypothetical protein